MEPVDCSTPFLREFVSPISKHPQYSGVIFGVDCDQVISLGSDHRHRSSVDRVGLSSVSAFEKANLAHQRRWDVKHPFAHSNELLGQEPPKTRSAFDSPSSLRPLPGPANQLRCGLSR